MASKRSSLISLPEGDRDTSLLPRRATKHAHLSVVQAEQILERALFRWLSARQSLEDAQQTIAKLAGRGTFPRQFTATLLSRILAGAIEATRADMGNIQIYDPQSGHLHIRVHRGFHKPFLEFFNSVDSGHAACGSALQAQARVIVPDIAHSPIFVGTRLLEVMLDAGVRAVQSTPLISRCGHLRGMLSTHHQTVTHPSENDLRVIDHFASWAAEILEADDRAARSRADTPASNGNGSHAPGR